MRLLAQVDGRDLPGLLVRQAIKHGQRTAGAAVETAFWVALALLAAAAVTTFAMKTGRKAT
ncbi:hypothetical protein Atai01_66140 [Amycolatopsis taiwanensis]|uniref:Uncharacterized protein n=1 Tax=Amycolatopsis taiwanensis TaxID=342230 RepID=A0A9W6VIS4_9PSEU|nr:hypothetical protein Atai01_66140 [Amycolatopsis taiwanensis]